MREPGTGRRRLGVESGAGSSTILLAFAAEAVPERRDGEPAEDTVEDVYEPFLIQQGLLQRTPKGRMATPAAFEHLGLAAASRVSRRGPFAGEIPPISASRVARAAKRRAGAERRERVRRRC